MTNAEDSRGFVHLHLHSEYSLLDGACRIREIPAMAKKCGHTAVALTDHGNMYGAVAFYRACVAEGIRPILGCEVYVAPRSRFEKSAGQEGGRSGYHLILLCKNMTGYRNLMYLVSKGYTEGFYSKPRIDFSLLSEHSEGLIGLSACLAGQIPQLLLAGDRAEATAAARRYAAIFAPGDFYIELQNHRLPEQQQILPELMALAKECGLPCVATNDCHYLHHSDAQTQAILMCIQTNTSMAAGRPLGFETDEFYYKTTEEMARLFADCPEALQNTVQIADKCRLELNFGAVNLPHFPCPDGISSTDYLRRLTEEGYARRRREGSLGYGCDGALPTAKEYEERMEYELSVIRSMGYDDYFLIVADYVNYAKQHDIPVGPGRGSGAGSLVAFFLGITDVDSLAFGLLFERFLNPERVSMPDIDVDFCYNRRDEVIRYVTEKYGEDHVSQIVTFGTMAARAAIRDVGRVMELPYSVVDSVARAIPQEPGITIDKARQLPELARLYRENAEVRQLVDTAVALEGMPRNMSVHAAGVLITEQPLYEHVPLAVSNNTVVSQYDMDSLNQLGLLKFDFLALRYLTICHDAEKQIREREPDFSLEKAPIDDPETYALIARGDTAGVFQLESAGMRRALTELVPTSLSDVQAAIALYRPGPMDAIPTYIANRQHPEQIRYEIPALEPILSPTYGCVVYQEQVMNIFRQVAGYSFGHADIVRRAMAKKKASVLEAERESFLDGAEKNGVSRESANRLFEEMSSFANYAFNQSHAASYALISFRTAYLKTHYPEEYMAALLTSVLGNIPKTGEYIAECQKRGIPVFPPDINQSGAQFHAGVSAEGKRGIFFGMQALKNVGRNLIDQCEQERWRNGVYRSLEDFVERLSSGGDLNRKQLETLIRAGVFDAVGAGEGINRRQMLSAYESMLESGAEKSRNNLSGQMDLFSVGKTEDAGQALMFQYPELPDYSLKEKLMQEKEASGMYFSGQLLDSYSRQLEDLAPTEIGKLLEKDENGDYLAEEKRRVCVAGIVNKVSYKITRKEDRIAFFTLEDRYATMECLAFATVLTQYEEWIQPDTAVCVVGTLSCRDREEIKLLVDKVIPLVENQEYQGKGTTDALVREEARPASPGAPATGGAEVRQAREVSQAPGGSSMATTFSGAEKSRTQVRQLFLRVPDGEGLLYRKALNLVEIFEGCTEVVFYLSDRSQYVKYRGGVDLTDYLRGQFEQLLGEQNVICR